MPKVFIVPPDWGFPEMFKEHGWDITDTLDDANLIQFTGGSDIHPSIYGHDPHPENYYNRERDRYELAFFEEAKERGIPMAGVCRGAQLFCALTGGWLWQDVEDHQGYHDTVDTDTGEVFMCNSIHHQMMAPHKSNPILAYANVCKRKDRAAGGKITTVFPKAENNRDPEVVFFPSIKGIGFQGHPEMAGHGLQSRYLRYIEKHLGLRA